MTSDQKKSRSEADAELEREILKGREFTLAEAIGRMAGPGAMKGVSPVPLLQQAEVEIESWLKRHLQDSQGILQFVLHRQVKCSDVLLNNFEQPFVALADYCRQVLDSDYLLAELVRECDVEWGRQMGERPYFEKQGAPHHPDDPYTIESVRSALAKLIEKIAAGLR